MLFSIYRKKKKFLSLLLPIFTESRNITATEFAENHICDTHSDISYRRGRHRLNEANSGKKNMKEHDYKILCELKERLSRKVSLSDMRLFGSRARGDCDEFSDFDVFIETETLDRKIRDIIKETAWVISLEYNILISSLIFSKSELTDSPLRSSPIVKNILNEGIRI